MNDGGLFKMAGIVEDGTKLKANEKIKTKTEINQKHVTFPRWARGIGVGGVCDNVHQLMLIRRQSSLFGSHARPKGVGAQEVMGRRKTSSFLLPITPRSPLYRVINSTLRDDKGRVSS